MNGHRTARGRGIVLTLSLGIVVIAAVAATRWSAARLETIPAPILSQQLNGAPPLMNLVQDQGNSIALPDGRTLWIFADTARVNGTPQFFVTSSAATAPGRSLTLNYLTGPGGVPAEFLPRTGSERANQVPGEHYTAVWPYGATALPDGRIVIAYAKYEVHVKPALDFRFIAGGLYEYRYQQPGVNRLRPGEPPVASRLADDIWTPADGPVVSPVYAGGQVYFLRCEDFVCYTLRTTPALLADRGSYSWWTGAGWSTSRSERARLSFGSDVPGRTPSIGYSARLGLFVMADTSGGIQSTTGRVWVARAPQGPWSRAASFPLPECPGGGCYTINVHPGQSGERTLRVSFATAEIGPYVRVTDVPIRVSASGGIPSIETGGTAATPATAAGDGRAVIR